MAKIDDYLSRISGAGVVISGILIAASSLLIFVYILNRQFIGQVWLFVEDWTGLALVAIGYLGMAYTLRKGKHLNVDIFIRHASPRLRNILDVIISIVALCVISYMLERSIDWFIYAYKGNVRTPSAVLTPVWIPSITMIVGVFILQLEMLFHLIRTIIYVIKKSSETDGYLKVGD